MQGIKALVIGMGVLIVFGTGVLIYGWTHKWGKIASSEDVAAAERVHAPLTEADHAANAMPYDLKVEAPKGMHFEQMTAAQDRVLLRFSGPQGERIIVVDPRAGRVVGAISVPAQPQ